MLQVLLQGGANPNLLPDTVDSCHPLGAAVREGSLDMVNVLLGYNAKPFPIDVLNAANSGHEDIAIAILRYVGTKYGMTEARSWRNSYCAGCKF